jgi:hypothetical protein
MIIRKSWQLAFTTLIVATIAFASTSFGYLLNGFQLSDALIPEALIKHGGPPRDGIPSIDKPKFLSAKEAGIKPEARVMGVYRNGIAKAYPILVMNWHEIVNDTFDNEPIAITYCPLCGTGMAFESTVDGQVLRFGVSGLLYNSDVLLYDRQTESLWSQLMVKSVAGPMKSKSLAPVVVAHTSFRDWQSRHPETLVLSSETGHARDYQRNPYEGYEDSKTVMFQVRHSSERFHPKELVMGAIREGKQKAWPFSEMRKAGASIKDTLDGEPVTVEFDDENDTARLIGADGKELPTVLSFWFAWYAFHPETEIFEKK